jgi:hypothetical protein
LGQNISLLQFYDIEKYRKSRSNEIFLPKNLANATFFQNQESH